MNDILNHNQAKRLNIPIPLLICYSMYTVWQMGIMFFTGTALSIDGKTPIPITAGNMTVVIAVAYLISAVYLIFFHKYSVITARIAVSVSLLTAIGMFLPLSADVLSVLITIQAFCCVFLIGLTISVVVGLFTEKSEIYDVLITAAFGYILIAVLQNDFIKIPFSVFRIFTVIALTMILLFFLKMPSDIWPQTVKKNSDLKYPMRFSVGIYLLTGLSCILTLFANTVGESIKHGISIISISIAVCGIVVFLIWKISGISPLRCAAPLIGLSAVGFVLALAGEVSPVFMYISCALVGCGCLACTLTSFYGIVLFKRYPSRFVAPIIVAIAVVTVLIHSSLLDLFRDNLSVLYILFSVMSVVAAVLFLISEPSLLWSMKRGEKTDGKPQPDTAEATNTDTKALKLSLSELDKSLSGFSVEPLSGQELRVAELVLGGYTNTEMTEILGITVNTVKSYRKNLYEKLQIHSRRELFSLVNNGKRE